MSKTLNQWRDEIHALAVEKGWWDKDDTGRRRSFGELIALCHSELSEALEHHRAGEPDVVLRRQRRDGGGPLVTKPDGWAIELVDVLIRVLDMMGWYKVDVEKLIEMKHEFNKTRPFRHGGKRL